MNTTTLLKKGGTTITPCPQCNLQALTNTKKQNIILCPFCGYASQKNSFRRKETKGIGIAAISHNGEATFYKSEILSNYSEKLQNHHKQTPPLYYITAWDEKNRIPVITDGSLKSLIDPTQWKPLPPKNATDDPQSGKVLKITATRGHNTKTAFIQNSNVYVHRTNADWDIYRETDLTSTHIPYELQPIQTIETTDPQWQQMIKAYRMQEGIEEYEDS